MLNTKEHADLITQFEREFKHMRLDKEEDKALWRMGRIYQNGNTNDIFLAYRSGYAFGKVVCE